MLGALLLTAAAGAFGGLAPLPQGQRHYSEACGGCHGLMGVSARQEIPVLSNRVGLFLCSPEGREYIVRLPNVAFAGMKDDQLAQALNFMVFGLGGTSVPADAALSRPFTGREVRALRARPLKARQLANLRDQILMKTDPSCLSGPRGRSAPLPAR